MWLNWLAYQLMTNYLAIDTLQFGDMQTTTGATYPVLVVALDGGDQALMQVDEDFVLGIQRMCSEWLAEHEEG